MEDEFQQTGERKRTPSASSRQGRSTGPKLNTWDVPEFLPGALPRANPVQRAFFEERSKKVFEKNLIIDKLESDESKKSRESEMGEKIESEMRKLREIFPTLELMIIQESYLEMECQLDPTITRLLALTDDMISPPRKGPPSCSDANEFPSISNTNVDEA
jgi:hypothetical protein